MNEYDWTKSKNEYPFFCIECMEPVEKDVCDTCGGEANDRWLICECEDFGTLQKWLDSVSGLKKYVPELPASVAHLRHYYKHTDSDVVDLCDYVDQLRARIAELEAAQAWRPASEPPEDSRRVLVSIAGRYKNNYITIAVYLHQWEEEYWGDCDSFGDYDKDKDMYYCPEGWYEISKDEEDYMFVDDPITGWRDLPPMPEVEK
jgi:hypothetical protein